MKNKQIAGFLVCPQWFTAPEKAEPYIRQMAEDGYTAVDILLRVPQINLYNGGKLLHDCLEKLTAMLHEHHLNVILDTDNLFWGYTFTKYHPECMQHQYHIEQVNVRKGCFDFQSAIPPVSTHVHGYVELETVDFYLPDGDSFLHLEKDQCAWNWQNHLNGYQIKGQLSDASFSGVMFACVTSRMTGLLDLSHPAFLKAQEEILDRLSDIPFDGFGWDEPGKGCGDPQFYRGGNGFLPLFRERCGYDLMDKIPYLACFDDTPEAVKVRLDYYSTLAFMNYEAQRRHNDYAEKCYGRKLFFGTHQTWSGLISDLAAGVCDYFQMGKLLSAAWTDGSWEVDLRYIAFHLMLADSLREELGLEDAYYNDWGLSLPAVENMHFATRFKMLYHVNWFNIFYSDFSENIINYRLDPFRKESLADRKILDDFDRFLNGMCADAPIGICYDWKSFAAAPKWLARLHYATVTNTVLSLTDSNLHGRFFSEDFLMNAELRGKELVYGRNRFKAVILPDLYVISNAAWAKLCALADQGFPVIFTGVPPMFTQDGTPLNREFADRLGIEAFHLQDLMQAYCETEPLPRVNEWEKETYTFLYPAEVTSGNAIRDGEERVIAVQSADNGMVFMTEPDPRENLVNLLSRLIGTDDELYAEQAYTRWFTGEDPNEKVLYFCACGRMADMSMLSSRLQGRPGGLTPRKARTFRAVYRNNAGSLKICNGSWCAVKFRNDVAVEILGDSQVHYDKI